MNPGYANSQAKQYKAQEIQTASPEEILILLYAGAIRFLLIAQKAIEKNDVEKSHHHLLKTQRIIMELSISLDTELGGEAAKNLHALYDYLHYRLVQANMKKDTTMIDEVLEHLRSLKTTWEEAIQIAKQEKAAILAGEEAKNEALEKVNQKAHSA